jgi:REP element-mobilizing transposase RayT
MRLNEYGNIADNCWKEIPIHYDEVEIDALQIMPNHMHAVILLHRHRHALGTIIGSYKAAVTKRIRELPGWSRARVWETNYYEHVIRNDDSLHRIRQYIVNNPLKWELDRYHPARQKRDETDDWLDFLADGQ